MGARLNGIEKVEGSSPSGSTVWCRCEQRVSRSPELCLERSEGTAKGTK